MRLLEYLREPFEVEPAGPLPSSQIVPIGSRIKTFVYPTTLLT